MTAHWVLATALMLIGAAGILLPPLRYLNAGWSAKRKDIMDGLNTNARRAYFEMFARSEPQPVGNDAHQQFEELYSRWFGRQHFILPLALLSAVVLTAVSALVLTGLGHLEKSQMPTYALPKTAMSAIAGAYLWVANDFISRARRLDFAPSDVLWGALRLMIAIPLGYAFGRVAPGPDLASFLAFALGAFPLASLIGMLQRLANRLLALETKSEAADELDNLQGVNKTIKDRLANEDILTVSQVAYCDPVRLVMRSNLNFVFVTDLMNQALAWIYLESSLQHIRPMGIRGACEIRCFMRELFDTTSEDPAADSARLRAAAALPAIAAKVNVSEPCLLIAFSEIGEDPYSIFLSRIWSDSTIVPIGSPK